MTQSRGELIERHALVIISVQAAENCGYSFSVSSLERRKSGKLVDIQTSIFSRDLGKFFFSFGLQGSATGVTSSFAFLAGEFTITICVKLCDVGRAALGTGGPAGLLSGLTLLFINLSILVKVELGQHFGKLAIAEGPFSIGTGSGNASSENTEKQVFGFHGSPEGRCC